MPVLRTLAAAAALGLAAPAFATTLFTGPAGQSQPFSQYQPSLALTQLVATSGIFPSSSPTQPGDSAVNTMGMVRSFAGNYEAFQARRAQGQTMAIGGNTALASILQDHFGGDGMSTFALPDLAGRTAIGTGQGLGLSNYAIGETTGAGTTTLAIENIAPHAHGLPGGGMTSAVGGLTPFSNYQPSLAMTYMISTGGVYQGGPSSMIGAVGLFGGNFAPTGWVPADGRMLAIDDFFALWTLIGTTYGGDGITHFAVPDLRGRAVIGSTGGPLGPLALGTQLGSSDAILTLGQMPEHDHDLAGGGSTDPAGGGDPVDNVQPSLALNYIIAIEGVFPPQTSGGGEIPFDNPFLGEVVAFSGGLLPRGWAFAHGQLLPIAQNQALFSILGTTYGGDGRVTFALPDLRGHVIVGTGQGFDLGMRFGSDMLTLTEANLPAHVHSYEVDNAIPEPATWGMLILGFGLAGARFRRRSPAIA